VADVSKKDWQSLRVVKLSHDVNLKSMKRFSTDRIDRAAMRAITLDEGMLTDIFNEAVVTSFHITGRITRDTLRERSALLLREFFNPHLYGDRHHVCQRCSGSGKDTPRGSIPISNYFDCFDCEDCNGRGRIDQWNRYMTPTVLTLANDAYHNRRESGRMDELTVAALADALEEAGCSNSSDYSALIDGQHPLLQHLRSKCNHQRGCWVVDTILKKEKA
jgi:hypothetical protein